MLSCYKVLDLADEKGQMCGKILGDLGADVIKVERPGGDPSRRIGPFYQDTPDPEKSLNWLAFNASKRGITLNLEDPEGQEIFLTLCETADVVIESFRPGYLESIGLGYADLSKRNPGLIMTSITPFGQTGPFRDRDTSDIGIMAMSGIAGISGYSDTPPLRMYLDQTYYYASAQGAAGTLTALIYRASSGMGQQVDVSIYESAVRANFYEPVMWESIQALSVRRGNAISIGGIDRRNVWPCKDGYVSWTLLVENPVGPKAFLDWLIEEGQAGEWADLDWKTASWDPQSVRDLEDTIGAFMRVHTVEELVEESIRRGLFLSPINDVTAVACDEQLAFRNFWKEIDHPELETTIPYPRYGCLTSAGGYEVRCRAPRIGEHNEPIYKGELGFSENRIMALKERGVL